MTRLILVERAAHAPRALEALKERNDGVLLALSPAVMTACEDAGAPFTIPEEHLAPDAIRKRGLENYALLEDLGDALEKRLTSLPEHLRLNAARLHFYRLKVAVDTIGLRALELAACVRALDARDLLILEDSTSPLWERSSKAVHLLTPDGPVYAAVAPVVAKASGLPATVERLPGEAPALSSSPLSRAASAANSARKAALARLGAAGAVWQLGEVAHDMPALLETLAPRFKIARWENALHGPVGKLLAREEPADRRALESFWAGLEPGLAKHPLFTHGGIDCAPLLLPALRAVFVDEHLVVCGVHAGLRRVVRRARPKAGLIVNTPYPENVAAGSALRAEGVPVVFIQEGGLYGYTTTPMNHYCELSSADHFLAYGRGAADSLGSVRATPRERFSAHPAGAIRLRRLRAARRPRKAASPPTVMYVASHFHHSLRYAPQCWGDREYFLLRRKALQALLRSGARVIYKGVPGTARRDDLSAFLKEHADRIEVCDEPLASAMTRADAFALDWPSTTLLELAATDRPIRMLLDSEVALPLERALPALRKRADVFLDREEFVESLRRPPSVAAVEDDDFLQAYGTGDWTEDRLLEFFEGLTPTA